MIIDFKIKNFRSYKDETEFSFEALDMDFRSENTTAIELENGETIRLLKTAAVFGANASGKSNLIWALYSLSHMVAGSLKYDVNTPIPYTPYVLNSKTRNQPTEFTINFIVDRKQYRYAIKFDKVIHQETLSTMKCNKAENIFNVEVNEETLQRHVSIGTSWESTLLDISNAQLLPNQL